MKHTAHIPQNRLPAAPHNDNIAGLSIFEDHLPYQIRITARQFRPLLLCGQLRHRLFPVKILTLHQHRHEFIVHITLTQRGAGNRRHRRNGLQGRQHPPQEPRHPLALFQLRDHFIIRIPRHLRRPM